MKSHPSRFSAKRAGSSVVLFSMLYQAIGPAFAVSPGYAGFVSQLPGIYTTPPDVNVMFTLDDSGSMQGDAIPDLSLPSPVSYEDVPTNSNSGYSGRGKTYPNMWGASSDYRAIDYYRLENAGDPTRAAVARYLRSAEGNPLYYNPRVTYKPWPKKSADKTQTMDPANPASVNIDPGEPGDSTVTVNLEIRVDPPSPGVAGPTEAGGYWPATYFVYKGATAMKLATPHDPNNIPTNFDKFEITNVAATTFRRYQGRTDCTGSFYVPTDAVPVVTGCTRAQELQNFANWLQYYRSRRLMAKGGVATAFSKQGTNLRVGFAQIGKGTVVRRGVRGFTGTAREDFFDKLYNEPSSDSATPLRRAMDEVGKYFISGEPWDESPGTTGGTEHTCRRSFHVMSTDGFWNGTAASDPADNNNDNLTGRVTPAKPGGLTYNYGDTIASVANDPLVGRFTVNPFKDGFNNTLSDVAAYYWRRDLRSSSDNKVVPTARDPAFWQHLTTFTIGLGITGSDTAAVSGSTTVPLTATEPYLAGYLGKPWLSSQGLRDALVAQKVVVTWPEPDDDNAATGDDLIHASMVGRGRYFSATNPTELATGLAAALAEVADQPLDLAAVAADSPQVSDGGNVYQATFSPAGWYGRLYAFEQSPTTGLVNNTPTSSAYTNPTQIWEASNKMPAPALRNIYTSTGALSSGVPFTWDETLGTSPLSTAQQTALGSAAVLNYLRGSAVNEVSQGGTLRDRPRYTVGGVVGGVLGDIVNGTPVKGPDAGGSYQELPAADPARASYAAYRSGDGLDVMRSTVFTAANDGMLHAFNLGTGEERFAYVPNAVYDVPRSINSATPLNELKLAMLADPAYTHRFTVDGPPNVADAHFGGSWHTVLVGSNGAGARGIFAMDVTNPDTSGGFDASKILWEYTQADNTDMGYVLAYPHVARMRNGSFAVIFGNGYDSTNGQAKLFILDLATKTVIREFAVGTAGDNGLSQPNFIVNTEREVIAIYAGDVKGNMWKFDVSDPAPASWQVGFSGQPLFTTGIGSNVQPISVMPELLIHPSGVGAMISFGTGKLFEPSDTVAGATNVNINTQSLYGIWDNSVLGGTEGTRITGGRAMLKGRDGPTFASGVKFATSTGVTPNYPTDRGWYIDLKTVGERSNLPPQQIKRTLFMVSNTPVTSDPCANGGSSTIFALDAATGMAPTFGTFDSNASGTIDKSDTGNVMHSEGGILTQPIFQVSSSSASPTIPTDVSTGPLGIFDRGQSTAAKAGGVVMSKSFGRGAGGLTGLDTTDCTTDSIFMTAAKSDTTLEQSMVGTNDCTPPAKGRVSWRQLQ